MSFYVCYSYNCNRNHGLRLKRQIIWRKSLVVSQKIPIFATKQIKYMMTSNKNYTIRQAERRDVPLLLEFIRGIAKYEKMEDEVVATAETLEAEMFDHHKAEAVFAVVDGKEVGFALFFFNFSTFIGHSGLYLEDLFVWPEYRGRGYGKALLLHLATIARE